MFDFNARTALEEMPPVVERPVFRRSQIVKALGVCNSTFHKMVRAGNFPPPDRRHGVTSLWDHATIERWLERTAAAQQRYVDLARACREGINMECEPEKRPPPRLVADNGRYIGLDR